MTTEEFKALKTGDKVQLFVRDNVIVQGYVWDANLLGAIIQWDCHPCRDYFFFKCLTFRDQIKAIEKSSAPTIEAIA